MGGMRRLGRALPWPDVAAAVARTPSDRDRVLDLLRAASMVVVVLGHALMGMVLWREGRPQLGNALASLPVLQPLTWVLQVLPIFFMVGAAAAARSWASAQARGDGYANWLWQRTRRLLRPVIGYLGIMSLLGFAIGGLADPGIAAPLLRLTTQLLWFLGAYLWVTAAVPALTRLRPRQSGAGMLLVLLAVTASDLARLEPGGPAALGLLNFPLVWMLVALIGVRLHEPVPGRRAVVLLVTAVATNLLLIRFLEYPVSMVGLPGDTISNMDPPSLVMAVHAIALYAAVIILRPALARWAQRPRVWRATVGLNLCLMTIYLWHLPVLTLLVLGEHALGWERPMRWVSGIGPAPAAGYWWWTLPHLAVFLAGLALVVRVAWSAEHRPLPWWDAEIRGRGLPVALSATGAVLAGAGIAVIAATGLEGFPVRVTMWEGVPLSPGLAAVAMVVGVLLLRRSASAPRADAVAQRHKP